VRGRAPKAGGRPLGEKGSLLVGSARRLFLASVVLAPPGRWGFPRGEASFFREYRLLLGRRGFSRAGSGATIPVAEGILIEASPPQRAKFFLSPLPVFELDHCSILLRVEVRPPFFSGAAGGAFFQRRRQRFFFPGPRTPSLFSPQVFRKFSCFFLFYDSSRVLFFFVDRRNRSCPFLVHDSFRDPRTGTGMPPLFFRSTIPPSLF